MTIHLSLSLSTSLDLSRPLSLSVQPLEPIADYILHVPTKHITVLCKGHFYVVQTVGPKGEVLTPRDFEKCVCTCVCVSACARFYVFFWGGGCLFVWFVVEMGESPSEV